MLSIRLGGKRTSVLLLKAVAEVRELHRLRREDNLKSVAVHPDLSRSSSSSSNSGSSSSSRNNNSNNTSSSCLATSIAEEFSVQNMQFLRPTAFITASNFDSNRSKDSLFSALAQATGVSLENTDNSVYNSNLFDHSHSEIVQNMHNRAIGRSGDTFEANFAKLSGARVGWETRMGIGMGGSTDGGSNIRKCKALKNWVEKVLSLRDTLNSGVATLRCECFYIANITSGCTVLSYV